MFDIGNTIRLAVFCIITDVVHRISLFPKGWTSDLQAVSDTRHHGFAVLPRIPVPYSCDCASVYYQISRPATFTRIPGTFSIVSRRMYRRQADHDYYPEIISFPSIAMEEAQASSCLLFSRLRSRRLPIGAWLHQYVRVSRSAA